MLFHVLVVVVGWTISFISGHDIPACPHGTVSTSITTTADMERLTSAMNCSGEGVFNVTLYGSVQIKKRMEVLNTKTVHMTGSGFPTIRAALRDNSDSSAVIDEGNTTGMFLVAGGSTLTIKYLGLEGGYSEHGGAVAVISSSSLHAIGCVFRDNSAAVGGEAIVIQLDRRSKEPTGTLHGRSAGPHSLTRAVDRVLSEQQTQPDQGSQKSSGQQRCI